MAKSALDKLKSKIKLKPKTLVGKQKNLDVNKNGKLDAEDFKMLRGNKMAKGGYMAKGGETIKKINDDLYIYKKLYILPNEKFGWMIKKNINKPHESGYAKTIEEAIRKIDIMKPPLPQDVINFKKELKNKFPNISLKVIDQGNYLEAIQGRMVITWWFNEGGDVQVAYYERGEYHSGIDLGVAKTAEEAVALAEPEIKNWNYIAEKGGYMEDGGMMANGGETSKDLDKKLAKIVLNNLIKEKYEFSEIYSLSRFIRENIKNEYKERLPITLANPDNYKMSSTILRPLINKDVYMDDDALIVGNKKVMSVNKNTTWKDVADELNIDYEKVSEKKEQYKVVHSFKDKMAEGGETFNADYWQDYYDGDKKYTFGGLDFKTDVKNSVYVLVKNQIKKWNEDNDDNVINVLGISDSALKFVGKKHYISNSIIDAMIMQEGSDEMAKGGKMKEGFKNTKDFEKFLEEIDGMGESQVKKIMGKDYIDTPGFYSDEKDDYEDVIDFMTSNMGKSDFEKLKKYWETKVSDKPNYAKGGELSEAKMIQKLTKKFEGKDLWEDEILDEYEVKMFDWEEYDDGESYDKWKRSKEKKNYIVPFDSQDDSYIFILVPKNKMEDGGETKEDLFYYYSIGDYENIPENVQVILRKYDESFIDGDYSEIVKAKKELNKIGYTFDIDSTQGGIRPENLRKMAKGGYMANGGETNNYKVGDIIHFEDDEDWKVMKVKNLSNKLVIKPFNQKAKERNISLEIDISMDYVNKNAKKMAKGGTIAQENNDMLQSNIKEIKHHSDELDNIVTNSTEVEPWVIAKTERASTDLSDVTHYLDGEKDKSLEMPFEKGGYMAKGGELSQKMSQEIISYLDSYINKYDSLSGYIVPIKLVFVESFGEGDDLIMVEHNLKSEFEYQIQRAKDNKSAVDDNAKDILKIYSKVMVMLNGYMEKGGYMAKGGEIKVGDSIRIKDGLSGKLMNIEGENLEVKKITEYPTFNGVTKFYHVEYDGYIYDVREDKIDYKRMEKGGYMAEGGEIEDQYKNLSAEEIWSMWTEKQKMHFIRDHKHEFPEIMDSTFILAKKEFKKLPARVQIAVEFHTEDGEYAMGGKLSSSATERMEGLVPVGMMREFQKTGMVLRKYLKHDGFNDKDVTKYLCSKISNEYAEGGEIERRNNKYEIIKIVNELNSMISTNSNIETDKKVFILKRFENILRQVNKANEGLEENEDVRKLYIYIQSASENVDEIKSEIIASNSELNLETDYIVKKLDELYDYIDYMGFNIEMENED